MQWILQRFEDTGKLGEALDQLGISYTWHKVVPFVGDLVPEPVVADPDHVVLFGSYSLWRYAGSKGYRPGVFKLRPFVHEQAWHPFLLNGADALFLTLQEVPEKLADEERHWFVRPVGDSKEEPGNVKASSELIRLAEQVLSLNEAEIPIGSLRHDTRLMLTDPVQILEEWRIWVVDNKVVTWSLYKEGRHVVYRHEIDEDALEFAQRMVDVNPGYAQAYVIDVCRTGDGLKILETTALMLLDFTPPTW